MSRSTPDVPLLFSDSAIPWSPLMEPLHSAFRRGQRECGGHTLGRFQGPVLEVAYNTSAHISFARAQSCDCSELQEQLGDKRVVSFRRGSGLGEQPASLWPNRTWLGGNSCHHGYRTTQVTTGDFLCLASRVSWVV